MVEALVKAVMVRTGMTLAEKVVLIRIGTEQGRANATQPLAINTIARDLDLSRATVCAAIASLEKQRDISRKRHRVSETWNEANTYSVAWVNNWNRRQRWLANQTKSSGLSA